MEGWGGSWDTVRGEESGVSGGKHGVLVTVVGVYVQDARQWGAPYSTTVPTEAPLPVTPPCACVSGAPPAWSTPAPWCKPPYWQRQTRHW